MERHIFYPAGYGEAAYELMLQLLFIIYFSSVWFKLEGICGFDSQAFPLKVMSLNSNCSLIFDFSTLNNNMAR